MKKLRVVKICRAAAVFAFAAGLLSASSISVEGADTFSTGGYTFGCGLIDYNVTVDEAAVYAVTACEYMDDGGCNGCSLNITSNNGSMNYVTSEEDGFTELITLKPGDYTLSASSNGTLGCLCIDVEKCSVPENDTDPLAPGWSGVLVPLTDVTKTIDITVDEGSSLCVHSFSNSGDVYEVHCSYGKKSEIYMSGTAFEDGTELKYPINGSTTFSFGFLPLKEDANGAVLIYVQE